MNQRNKPTAQRDATTFDGGASADARLRATPPETLQKAVSVRAVTIGLLCAAFFCAVTPYNDFKIAATYIAGTQFPIGALAVLLILVGIVNVIFRKFAPSKAFRPGELMTVWTLILAASGIPSSGMMRYFLPAIVFPLANSDDKNNWEAKVWGDAPEWLKMHDKEAADAFFKGYPRGQEHVPWGAWAGPLFFWGILAVLFVVASFCIAALLRKQWVENEKFTFPLVTLPLLLAEEPTGGRLINNLLRTPTLWLAFFLVTAFHTERGLHLLYPSVPDISGVTNVMDGDLFKSPPWNQIGPIELWYYPLVVGLSYLLPAEVCFSMWFFHLFYKAEIFLGASFNWDMPGPVGGYSYKQFHGLQAFGGGVALLAWTAWTARRHLSDVWEKATSGPRAHDIDDSREMLSYRALVLGFLVSYGGIALWLGLAGVPILLIALSLLMLTLALVVISWVVCQAGLLFMAQPYATTDILATTFGTAPFKIPSFYTTARWENMFIYDTREMLSPSLIEGGKAAESIHFDVRALFKAMAVSVAMAMVISCVASLMLPYYNGGGNSLNNPFMYKTAPSRPISFSRGPRRYPTRARGQTGSMYWGGLQVSWDYSSCGHSTTSAFTPSVFVRVRLLDAPTLVLDISGLAGKSLIQRYGGMNGYKGASVFPGLDSGRCRQRSYMDYPGLHNAGWLPSNAGLGK